MSKLNLWLSPLFLAVSAAELPAQEWLQKQQLTVPWFRFHHVMTYHPMSSANPGIYLHGGHSTSYNSYWGDTWRWDRNVWAPVPVVIATPPFSPRAEHSATFVAARGVTVIHGGRVLPGGGVPSFLSNETWEFDGLTWTQIPTPVSPPPRQMPAIATDQGSGTVVMFGGRGPGGSLNETWEYDGVTWIQVFPAVSPLPRENHAMAFDEATGQVVMFGGTGSVGFGQYWLNDVWTYLPVAAGGPVWTQWFAPDGSAPPSAREGLAMVYDSGRRVITIVGGHNGSLAQSDVWQMDLAVGWQNVTPPPAGFGLQQNNPAYIYQHAMAYDRDAQECVVYGGLSNNFTNQWIRRPASGSLPAGFAEYRHYGPSTDEVCRGPFLFTDTRPRINSVFTTRMRMPDPTVALPPCIPPAPLFGACFLNGSLFPNPGQPAASPHLQSPTVLLQGALVPDGFGNLFHDFQIPIPNDPALAGLRYYLQCWYFDQSTTPVWGTALGTEIGIL
ncbi:MAG TPA: kelch repeat-containing protein [Planctomycetota bacterium]|nr:kelch repeat-containing protein [Planctomycetota bacterium]